MIISLIEKLYENLGLKINTISIFKTMRTVIIIQMTHRFNITSLNKILLTKSRVIKFKHFD